MAKIIAAVSFLGGVLASFLGAGSFQASQSAVHEIEALIVRARAVVRARSWKHRGHAGTRRAPLRRHDHADA